MSPIVVIVAAFVGVTALVAGVAMFLRRGEDSLVEDRLEALAGGFSGKPGPRSRSMEPTLLNQPLGEQPGLLEQFGIQDVDPEQLRRGLEPVCGRCRVPLAVSATPMDVTDGTFEDATLRIDYFHTGDATTESAALDQLWRQGIYAGSRVHLVDDLDLGPLGGDPDPDPARVIDGAGLHALGQRQVGDPQLVCRSRVALDRQGV